MFQAPDVRIVVILPLLLVVIWAIALMLVDLFLSEQKKKWISWLTIAGLLAPLVYIAANLDFQDGGFIPAGGNAMVVSDPFSSFLSMIFLVTGILSVLLSINYLRANGIKRQEYYYLMLFSISGMMLMGMANDLILVFLALELLSIPLYVLAAFGRPRQDSEEAAMKYFLLGAFASGFLLFGIALIYGATGTTALPGIVTGLEAGSGLALAGASLLLVGLGFKVAAVPFHMWTPDVYEGAPTPVTAFMSVGAKVGGFAALIRIFVYALPSLGDTWVPALAILAALTMILGNVVALAQTNIKRMLAYSSIAHAGYILIGVAAALKSDQGVSATLIYMAAYLFTNLGAFAVVIALEHRQGQGLRLDDYKGLAKRSPLLAILMAIFMLSLTGMPPTGGFTGKFLLFKSALEADLLWLAIVGAVTSVISAYFYLRVVFYSFMFDGEGEVTVHAPVKVVLAITVFGTLLLGLLPSGLIELAQKTLASLQP